MDPFRSVAGARAIRLTDLRNPCKVHESLAGTVQLLLFMRHAVLLLVFLFACDDERVSTTTITAADQSENPADVVAVAAARRALLADGSLGIRGKNALVIVQRGVATVRGRVDDEAQRRHVLADVAKTPGIGAVVDRLEVP